MDYGRRELADRLAAEYVLGSLRGAARRRFEDLLPAHPGLREAVAQWQQRLTPLSSSVAPVTPSPQVWPRIEQALFGASASAPVRQSWWQGLAFWRGLGAVTTAAAVVLTVLVVQVPPAQPPVVVVLTATPQEAQALQASFVASISGDGRALVLRPLQAPHLEGQRALELWAVPAQGAPRSLGLVQAQGATTLLRSKLLQDTAALAVSVEPSGGSPTGAPTGPIVSVGKLQT